MASSADTHLTIENPATEAALERLCLHNADDLRHAVAAARSASAAWGSDETARREALRKIGDSIRANVDDLATLLTQEQGKPVGNARIEVNRAASWFDHYAVEPLTVEVSTERPAEIQVTRRPIGLIAAITPSNYPLLMAAFKLAPALLAGNAVILKPSPDTPLATLRLGELINAVLPNGVLTVLVGDVMLGRALVEHPAVSGISFTGSPGVGWSIADRASSRTRLILELGGNDPAILMPDADVAGIAQKLFAAAFLNNGQACVAIKRIYAPQSLAGELTEALAVLAQKAVVGNGLDPGTQFGPLVTADLRDKVDGLVRDAQERGAKIVAGGRVPNGPGHFYLPTIVGDANDEMKLVSEEQFGPALPILTYADLDSVIETVNGGQYGLGGSVWGEDVVRARSVATRLDCGMRWVNCHAQQDPGIPMGGRRSSGLGVENGAWGLDSYSDLAVDYVSTA